MLQLIQTICEVILALGVIGGGILVYTKVVRFMSRMESDTQTIMTNHLPHIYEMLSGLRADVSHLIGDRVGQHTPGNS